MRNLKLKQRNIVLALKLVLIILLNKTYALIAQDSEIVLLPAWNSTEANCKEISLTLKVFGKLIQLNLHRSDQFVSPAFGISKYNAKNVTQKLSKLKASNSCIYIHDDNVSAAAINICQKHGLVGFIFVENDILEIRSLWNMFAPLPFMNDSCVRQQNNQSFGTPHLVKKSQQHFTDSDLYHSHEIRSKRLFIDEERKNEQRKRYTIELAIIVDVTAYHMFNKNFSYIYNLIHTYVNNMQTFFHHPSLHQSGVYVDIVFIYLYIMRESLPNFKYIGNTESLLYTFCDYFTSFNPPNDDDLYHWDIALYLSGINFHKFVHTPGFTSVDYTISAKSHPDGACNPNLSCAVVEFLHTQVGSPNSIKTASLNAVRQIGILLGLREMLNEEGNSYIMSTEQPYGGNITWSVQSRYLMKKQLEKKWCLQDNQLDRPPFVWDYEKSQMKEAIHT